jgi:hypothetical protein
MVGPVTPCVRFGKKGVQRTARPTYEIQSHQKKRSMLSSKQVPEK